MFTVCSYIMCTADVIHRAAYIIHDCGLAEITEHFFSSHQTYQVPCTLFLSVIIFELVASKKKKKIHRDHVVQHNVEYGNEAVYGKNEVGRHHTIFLHLRRV